MMRCCLLAAVLLLASCQSLLEPDPVSTFYTRPLSPALAKSLGGLVLADAVPHPAVTRYASLASRQPYFGLLVPPKPGQVVPAFGTLPVDRLMDVPAFIRSDFGRQLGERHPQLARELRADGRTRLQIEILHIGIFGKNVRNDTCQPMLLMRADARAADGRLEWSSGFVNNRLDDRIAYPCQALATDAALARTALQEAMSAAIADLMTRMRS